MKFISEGWLKTLQEEMNTNPEYQKKAQKLVAIFTTLVPDCSHGVGA